MRNDYEDIQIDGLVFRLSKIEAQKGLKAFATLANMINRPLSKVGETLINTDFGDLKNPAVLLPILSNIIGSLNETDFVTLDNWIKSYVSVQIDYNIEIKGAQVGDFAPLTNPVVYEAVFRGNLDRQILVIYHWIRTNFLESIKKLVIKNMTKISEQIQ